MADVEMGGTAPADPKSDADPIKKEYDVYIRPHISNDRQIYILQFPNRESKAYYSKATNSQPQNLRIKPQSGMVELDVPVDAFRNYDKEKGLRWGEAMKKSSTAKGTGSFGLPGGFGIGGAQPAGRGRGAAAAAAAAEANAVINQGRVLEDYAGAVEREQVLVRQTLGGQTVRSEESTPRYMIGAFRGDQLHLTPIDHIVQLRPQFHHVDAAAEQEKQSKNANTAPVRMSEARAIHMTVKSVIDGEEDTQDNLAVRISATQQEAWEKHRYIDEDSADAWQIFHENLFVRPQQDLAALTDPDRPVPDLKTQVPKLVADLDNGQYLDSISAPRDAARLSRSKQIPKGKKDEKGKGIVKEEPVNWAMNDAMMSDLPSSSESEEDDE
ncbi:hypothetical protein B7494_g6547 [Chlorociboria aeruginascens]|nr:hypothetical protein B7494_g6547 [Chlorociboria aeruginascens]